MWEQEPPDLALISVLVQALMVIVIVRALALVLVLVLAIVLGLGPAQIVCRCSELAPV